MQTKGELNKMAEQIVYQGRIIEVINKDVIVGDKTLTFEIARRAPGVRLIFVTAKKILLTKEYRHEHSAVDFRLPGGKVFDKLSDYNAFLESKGDLVEAAKTAVDREAFEEVGLKPTNKRLFHISKCGATVDWTLYYFIIDSFENIDSGQNLEHGEEIELFWCSHDEARKLAIDGSISEDRSVGVLLRYLEEVKFN